jgi:MFS family permease
VPVTVKAAGSVGQAVRRGAADLSPLRESAAFRRLFVGLGISRIGSQVTAVAVPLQAYDLTHSSLVVGLVGFAALMPLVVFGLYGGAIADAVDRRKLLFVTSAVMMAASVTLLAQAVAGLDSLGLLFACVVVQAAASAVDAPTRMAVIPQVVPASQLTAANTLDYTGTQVAIIVGPLLAGVAVSLSGFGLAYGLDVASFAAAFVAVLRVPALLPGAQPRRAGLASVTEGLRFIAIRPVLLMTFVVDIDAMLFAYPRALFPALAYTRYGGGALTVGLLYAAQAGGAVLAAMAGGLIGRVRRQGLGVIVAIVVWGAAITVFGLVSSRWLALVMLAVAGAADTVSTVYRSTMLQAAAPASLQGRMQGVYNVVVTGGPRLGDLRAGLMASAWGAPASAVWGGLACVASIGALALAVPAFRRYDSNAPSHIPR